MSVNIVESVLTGKLEPEFLIKWLNNESLEDSPEDCVLLCCNRNEFVAYFLSFLRNQTNSILQTNTNALQVLQHQSTPEKLLSSRKHQRSISDPTYEADRSNDSLSVKVERRSHESPSKDKKRTGRRVKTKLFSEEKSKESISSDDSRLSSGVDRMAISSTPMKNGLKLSEYPNLPLSSPVTPHSRSYERCDTPRLSHRHSRSQEKSCLGDYLVTAQKSSKKKKSGRILSDDSDVKTDLDLSNSDVFPEIGARKSSSLKSDKRRIKPTNIDRSKKSVSLNSFNSECFQQTSALALEDNEVFRQQKLQPKELSISFDAERNILKHERHKLMEKFNILNTSSSPKPSAMPQIKVTQRDSFEKVQNFVEAEPTKVSYKDKLDILVEVYDALLKNNLILSMNTEIYFLISILLSKQYEDDYLEVENKLNENSLTKYLLKSIHNSTYFVVKSLWYQKGILEVILDKNSLKLLGENKKLRSFFPDLAKFLLNSYGLKCEAENQDHRNVQEVPRSNGVICFNLETDNADNFPSLMSFQNFKKQRDMFYEILRWYNDTQSQGNSTAALKSRVKALICCGSGAANLAHLAALLARHMLAELPPAPDAQESRVSKLSRRLTRPARAPAPPAHPHFHPHEIFYKDFITCAESESFRVHVRHALASELVALHHMPLPTTDTSKEYVQLSKKLGLLAKFLGFVTSLPYSQTSDVGNKSTSGRETHYIHPVGQRESLYTAPKEKVLENHVALRNYSQPCIDLKGMLAESIENGRLCLTIPWLVQYLSMLDYTSLRIKYNQELLKSLFEIYVNKLKLSENQMKKNTIIFLKSTLGWLFSLPHCPQELFYEKNYPTSDVTDSSIDNLDLIDEPVLFELCPYLRDVNTLLSTCRVSQDQREMGSFRHITPISLTLNPEERMRNKEKELQSRLEEEFIKSQPASTRRVLELVTERVCAHALREVSRALAPARDRARARAADALRNTATPTRTDHASLLQTVECIYSEELVSARAGALECAGGAVRARAARALAALLPAAPAPLAALAAARCRARIAKWLHDNWSTTAVLCKDIEGELRNLLALGDVTAPPAPRAPPSAALVLPQQQFTSTHVSAAEAIINLKEQICLLLDHCPTPALCATLAACATACSPNNVFCRPPAMRAILQLSVDLCIVFVSRRPKEVTESFLLQLHAIWGTCCPDRRAAPMPSAPERRGLSPDPRGVGEERAPTPHSDDETDPQSPSEAVSRKVTNLRIVISNTMPAPAPLKTPTTPNENIFEDNSDTEFFERVLCPRNIAILSASSGATSGADVWEALATVLVFMLRHEYLSEDCLTEQCLAVYRQDWPQSTLERLSTCMRSVSSKWSSTGKFTLFLDFLAEYCCDMDIHPLDE